MLMITEERKGDVLTFKLIGALAGDWAIEFRRCWSSATESPEAPRVIVELTEVTFVDDKGKELLGEMMSEGAQVIAFDILMNSIVEELSRNSSIA